MKTIQDLIDFFEPIPENKWCVDALNNSEGQCCALGHLIEKFGDTVIDNVWEFAPKVFNSGAGIVGVNNEKTIFYPQPTPKQRVLAFLHNLAAQEK